MVPSITDDRGGVGCPDTADTSAMRRTYTLLERVEKPLRNEARVFHHAGECAQKYIIYLFLMICRAV
jgi:hypothetical protein